MQPSVGPRGADAGADVATAHQQLDARRAAAACAESPTGRVDSAPARDRDNLAVGVKKGVGAEPLEALAHLGDTIACGGAVAGSVL